jgi:SAM-dependent methyltransferase
MLFFPDGLVSLAQKNPIAPANSMTSTKEHYDQHLASIYSWMSGVPDAAIARNYDLFCQLKLDRLAPGLAIDLGAGSGFQSIPLAQLGFSVVAVDFCGALLAELRDRAPDFPILTVEDDLLKFADYLDQPAQVIVCMGDTLTHLASLEEVRSLLKTSSATLAPGGKLVLTFRDYVNRELAGTQRFIPVRSDDSTILTCFLEYRQDRVEVFDLVHKKESDRWTLHVSSYLKLRLDPQWICAQLQQENLSIVFHEPIDGMIGIVAEKS